MEWKDFTLQYIELYPWLLLAEFISHMKGLLKPLICELLELIFRSIIPSN
jgi:hypothetical protein